MYVLLRLAKDWTGALPLAGVLPYRLPALPCVKVPPAAGAAHCKHMKVDLRKCGGHAAWPLRGVDEFKDTGYCGRLVTENAQVPLILVK